MVACSLFATILHDAPCSSSLLFAACRLPFNVFPRHLSTPFMFSHLPQWDSVPFLDVQLIYIVVRPDRASVIEQSTNAGELEKR